MKKILDKNIWIKDYNLLSIILLPCVLLGISYSIPLQSNSDIAILIGVEQAFFVILSAILFVFHDSIIGFQSISKLRNDINKLSSTDIKDKILAYINISEQSANYDEFLTKVDRDMAGFTKESDKFKEKSYKLYVIFAILGLIAITLSLIGACDVIDKPTHFFIGDCNIVNKIILDFCVYGQISLMLLWIISAFQAEEQKRQMFNFISIDNIKENIKNYIDEKNKKEIEWDMSDES